jgi:hypothetical protein
LKAEYEDFFLENDQNDWVVIPDCKANKQQTKETKNNKSVWKIKAPPDQVQPKPTEDWIRVPWGKINYSEKGDMPLNRKD